MEGDKMQEVKEEVGWFCKLYTADQWHPGDREWLLQTLAEMKKRIDMLEEGLLCLPVISALYEEAKNDFEDGKIEQLTNQPQNAVDRTEKN